MSVRSGKWLNRLACLCFTSCIPFLLVFQSSMKLANRSKKLLQFAYTRLNHDITNGDSTLQNEANDIRHHLKAYMMIERRLSQDAKIICDLCIQSEASIFQNEGNFCLSCWQDRTDPHVT
jgi:hypothetical protein